MADTFALTFDLRRAFKAVEDLEELVGGFESVRVKDVKLEFLLSSSGYQTKPYPKKIPKYVWGPNVSVFIAGILETQCKTLEKARLDIRFEDGTRPNINHVVHILCHRGVVMENLEDLQLVGDWGVLLPGLKQQVMPKVDN